MAAYAACAGPAATARVGRGDHWTVVDAWCAARAAASTPPGPGYRGGEHAGVNAPDVAPVVGPQRSPAPRPERVTACTDRRASGRRTRPTPLLAAAVGPGPSGVMRHGGKPCGSVTDIPRAVVDPRGEVAAAEAVRPVLPKSWTISCSRSTSRRPRAQGRFLGRWLSGVPGAGASPR